jgi:hypothetical protein
MMPTRTFPVVVVLSSNDEGFLRFSFETENSLGESAKSGAWPAPGLFLLVHPHGTDGDNPLYFRVVGAWIIPRLES